MLAADGDWTAEAAIRFWTPERMDSATDPSGRTAPPEGSTAAARRPSADGVTAQHFKGIKSVGTIFSEDKGLKGHRCTASVVRSGGHNLILTAGHCAARIPCSYPGTTTPGLRPRSPMGSGRSTSGSATRGPPGTRPRPPTWTTPSRA
ncbi:hypothetical protein ACFQ51_48130 [Streptomyces kaempferi]